MRKKKENLNKRFVVYKITNLINLMFYIGQTFRNPEKRWQEHKNASKKVHTPLYHAMQYYGIENFKFEVIEECLNLDDLNKREEYLISSTNNVYPNGYNLKNGGLNKEYSDFSKLRISQSNKGKIHSLERKMTTSKLSKKMWNKEGFKEKHSLIMKEVCKDKEYIKKKSESSLARWKNEDYRNKMSALRKGVLKTQEHKASMTEGMLKAHAKPFEVYKILENKELGLVGIWENVTKCAKELNLLQPKVSSVLYGNRKSHKGYFFKFI